MSDSGLKAIVADLHCLGYLDADIAIVMGRSERRIGQILAEVCPPPARLTSVNDLPFHMKQRVLLWREQEDANVQPLKVGATIT